jgi:hypothetical protein
VLARLKNLTSWEACKRDLKAGLKVLSFSLEKPKRGS